MKIKRSRKKQVRIEMLPLIDIVFLLLVFFIYAMLSMAVHNGLQLDLPVSSTVEQSPESPLSLFIREKGDTIEVFIGEEAVPLEELRHYMAGNSIDTEQKTVLVFAEKQISYQQLYSVLDQIIAAGVSEISLQATRIQQE